MRAARIAQRVGVAVFGTATVAVGLLLVPLPGPGWPVVFAGVALLGTEYAWARRIADSVRSLARSGMQWSRQAAWPVRATIGAALLFSTLGPIMLLTPRA